MRRPGPGPRRLRAVVCAALRRAARGRRDDLERELARSMRQQEALARVSVAALRAHDHEDLLSEAAEIVAGTLGGDSGRADGRFVDAVAHVLSIAADRDRADEERRHAALHDALTGLPNRALALDRLGHALARRRREPARGVAVMVLDLDRFKLVNDSLGHDVGDEMLVALAARLETVLRPADTVARLGGDEFAVVCDGIDGARAAVELAGRLGGAVAKPMQLPSGERFSTASIGIAMAGATDTPHSLLRDAHAAMHRVKEGGRGGVELFDEALRRQVVDRLRTETDLRRAVLDDQLRVHYQPVTDMRSGETVSVEALVRWQHPERGLVAPAEFIPIAEDAGLIGEIGEWVLDTACRQVATWQREIRSDLGLCVNVSGRQLADPGFPGRVLAIARQAGLAPGTLALEVTESVFIGDADPPCAALTALREQDIGIVLDDFGTGYSSLAYLKRFPLDALKIDRSFVRGLGSDPDDSAIAEAVISLATALGVDVVAEGVETSDQLDELDQLGCIHVQGYLLGRPQPAQGATRRLSGTSRRAGRFERAARADQEPGLISAR